MSERIWTFYVDDMIAFAEKVLSYTEGFDYGRFVASGLTYDATLRNLELIGEAATHVPAEVPALLADLMQLRTQYRAL
jgi:uncharacterized protein with HEPN domain